MVRQESTVTFRFNTAMAKKKGDNAAAIGAAIAAGIAGPGLQSGGRITYAPRLSESSEVNLSSEPRTNSLGSLSLLVNGTPVDVQRLQIRGDTASFEIDGRAYSVELLQSVPEASANGRARKMTATLKSSGAPGDILSPLPGIVSELLCKKGDVVTAGQLLLRIEAMKMQNNVYADIAGTISALEVAAGEEVAAGQRVVLILRA